MAFPTTGVLDNFTRADEGPPPSASWTSTGMRTASPTLFVTSNTAADDGTGGSNAGGAWGTQFGPASEVYVTWTTLPNNASGARYWIRAAQIGDVTVDGYFVSFTRVDGNPGFDCLFVREDDGTLTQLGATTSDTSGALSAGVKFGADMSGSVLSGYVNRAGTWQTVDSRTDSTYSAAGYIGLSSGNTTIRFGDFGGGNTAVPGVGGLAWIKA